MSKEIRVRPESFYYSIINSAMKVPGVKISRDKFLRSQLSKRFPEQVVVRAIEQNPAKAGISKKEIEKLARACINNESMRVTSISAASGIPGGIAMVGTVPADTAQYFAHVIRILQKLVYLYGWQDIYDSEDGLDDETMNKITVFLGVMFGVGGTNKVIAQLGKVAAVQVEKDLAKKALTKGTIYPVVKKVATNVGVKVTKQTFARGVGKTIPVAGALISGAFTYSTFPPLAKRLKTHLKELPIADPDFFESQNNYGRNSDIEIIDIDVEDSNDSTNFEVESGFGEDSWEDKKNKGNFGL